jgi:CRP/FNR family transcriptional regulator
MIEGAVTMHGVVERVDHIVARLPAAFPPYPGPDALVREAPVYEPSGRCTACRVREQCLPAPLEPESVDRLEELISVRLYLRPGDTLYDVGRPFSALYAIRSGSCKATVLGANGCEQVAEFYIAGDLIGMDGIETGRHASRATALEDTEVCVLPFDALQSLARGIKALQRSLLRHLSHEVARRKRLLLTLGNKASQERLAIFLLDLSERYRRRGHSGTQLVLRLTRQELGSHLGLALETVSRIFAQFQRDGLLRVTGRSLELLDIAALRRIAGG